MINLSNLIMDNLKYKKIIKFLYLFIVFLHNLELIATYINYKLIKRKIHIIQV